MPSAARLERQRDLSAIDTTAESVVVADDESFINKTVLAITAAFLLITPVFLGGKEPVFRLVLSTSAYLLTLITLLPLISNYRDFSDSLVKLASANRVLWICFGLFLLLGFVQLIPLPVRYLNLVSSESARLYSDNGQATGSFSVDRANSISSLVEVGAYLALLFMLSTIHGGGSRPIFF